MTLMIRNGVEVWLRQLPTLLKLHARQYAGDPEAMMRVHNAHPGKYTYWTEGGPDYNGPNCLTDWTRWSSTFAGTLRNWSRCIRRRWPEPEQSSRCRQIQLPLSRGSHCHADD